MRHNWALWNTAARSAGEHMANVTVYFATDGVPQGATTDWQSYRGDIIPPTAAIYPPTRFRMLDCAQVNDYNLLNPPDASHQYYRRSPRVRDKIVAAMRKDPNLPGGLIQL
jgi:hypothetical protein